MRTMQVITDTVTCFVIDKNKYNKLNLKKKTNHRICGFGGLEIGIASNYIPNHLTRHRCVEVNCNCHSIFIDASLSELCRFV